MPGDHGQRSSRVFSTSTASAAPLLGDQVVRQLLPQRGHDLIPLADPRCEIEADPPPRAAVRVVLPGEVVLLPLQGPLGQPSPQLPG
ncbi:hypothetical protein A605_01200 [Corynebacterium halotolerans YIM 70093 = DSM 44683]|uniref:Uncharacterized protein n=1 Tax=Corynebacterium halotolerans YIM 70093 = DSM 44683 TaxID=1121362 RepID=M1MU57_9CORY|nr:hypothetical protein A605_01200 [Corynebacterium halotolerans YIM 70093 = DSM 44683]